ncbi:hypothetical protein L916_04875 [Phytophthora nicotianae]|uniref:Uncharacterized protein n=1 Tax=Phytophthora nicotianae TaxID=4792 RepID=W2JGP7_PHYNI|nr:hypothetical protein L916_04875 [Phytophthora nicotianae]
MEEQRPRLSCDSDESTALTWQDQVHKDLKSDAVRLRLQTYSTLSEKCSESKDMQKQVGQLFGGPRNGVTSSLLTVLFDDLHSTDKTLRIAAARVLCLMAYENLTNQQMIIRSQDVRDEEHVGITIGWVHVFSIPQLLRDRYEAQCEKRGVFTTSKGLIEFVSNLIKDNYASIYSRIGRYYAEGCHEFLPLCWSQALVNDSSESVDMDGVPDPNENVLGFYLVPRQMQFPEQDDYFLHDILASIQTRSELSRLQRVHTAFEQVAFRATEANAAILKTVLEGIYSSFNSEEEADIADQRQTSFLEWLDAFPKRMITWNEILSWCCTDMNTDEMLKRFGAESYRIVCDTFQKLTFGGEGQTKDQANYYVWESTLVGALLNHPDLPHELKANIRAMAPGCVNRLNLSHRKANNNAPVNSTKAFECPWEYLFPLELTEINPISWSVFLSKWRQSADAKPEEDPQIFHQSDRRHHSVGDAANPALLVARKNALATLMHNPRIFHSLRDLNQLRQQLPFIANRPPEVREESAEFPASPSRSQSIQQRQLSEAERRELKENRKLFRKFQRSSIELDEATRQRIETKREARNQAHERAAENRKKNEKLAIQRIQELARSKRDKLVKVQERIQRKEYRWKVHLEARQERHERVQWWKQMQHEDLVARQVEFMRQKEEDDAARRLEQNQHTMSQNLRRSEVSPPRAPTTERQYSCPRRPQSARTATDPQTIRERANVYGCAASKAFAARRPQTTRADFYSGTKSPSKSASFRRVRPASAGPSRNVGPSAAPAAELNRSDPLVLDVENACQTLVMTNAAHAVAQEIAIPSVPGPVPEEEIVPPAVIMAQYLALEKEQRFKLHERYCVNRVSHKLTFAVLQQLTHEMRQDAAWREFAKAAGGAANIKRNKTKRDAKVTYTAFASVAHQLGITMPPKRIQVVARSLDPWKTGFVSWESFYPWWSKQLRVKGHMATPSELSELERGDGAWENIQEVLRFGFRKLWKVFAGVDSRVKELENAVAIQKDDSLRQHQHLEAIAKTLNAMSEQLRLEQEETTNQQIEARLQHLECQIQDQLAENHTGAVDNKARIAKIERRLDLIEEEMGHFVTAIEQKADAEGMLAQGRALEESIRKRCKKEAFDQEVLKMQERLLQQRQELENELSLSISDFRTAQETHFHSEMENWAGKIQESTLENVQTLFDHEIQKQGEAMGSLGIQIKLCCDALEAQQRRMDDFQVEIDKKVRETLVADREEIALQCSEAHGQIDYQFRTQEAVLERIRVQQEEIATSLSKRDQQTLDDINAAVENLDRRVLDRENQELEKLRHHFTEEIQLTIANALKALELAKDREQRKLKQHQHVVGRKLAELDQMMQLIGRQLIQNTSQLQVVRNEQLEYSLQSEDAGYSDDELLLPYDDVADNVNLPRTPVLPAINETSHSSTIQDAAELVTRRSQHQELQGQLDKKLRDYSQVLSPSRAQEERESLTQPTQSPRE